MGYRVAVNGFGRIGRDYVRCLIDRELFDTTVTVVGINDLWDAGTLAHLLQYDSTFGRLSHHVDHNDDSIGLGGTRIPLWKENDPAALPWAELDVDLVIESTGRFRARDDAARHLKAGARQVLISAPGKQVDATVVRGVNDVGFDPRQHEIVSAASCTTNCAAPMAAVLHGAFGIEQGYLTTVHAYTNDQVLLDTPHKDRRRARAGAVNIIPTSTGAAKAIGLVLPELAGRFDGVSLRVPFEDASLTDMTCLLARDVSVADINDAFAMASAQMPEVLRYTEAPVVSRDIIGDPASCVFDAGLTQAGGRLVKIFGWYDNEWGYTNRLVDLTELMSSAR